MMNRNLHLVEMPDPKDQVQFVCSLCLHFIYRQSILKFSRPGAEPTWFRILSPSPCSDF